MSTEVMTAVIFGYNLSLNEEQKDSLENQDLTTFYLGQRKKEDFYLVGYKIMETSVVGQVAEVELGSVDFSKYEEQLQEIMKLVNIEVDKRPKVLLGNYYY